MRFMLLHAPRGTGDWQVMSWAPEDLKAHLSFMKRFAEELGQSGELVSAEGLASPAEAKIVRATAHAAPAVADGPFPEAKEFLAGYWIVEVEQPERAYEIAAKASAAPGKAGVPLNMPIEVRQLIAGHYRLDAVRGHLRERMRNHDQAIAHYRDAAERTTSIPERNYLTARAVRLAAARQPAPDRA
jgi:hypothetical protein